RGKVGTVHSNTIWRIRYLSVLSQLTYRDGDLDPKRTVNFQMVVHWKTIHKLSSRRMSLGSPKKLMARQSLRSDISTETVFGLETRSGFTGFPSSSTAW